MRWLIVMPYARPGAMGIDFAEELRALGHVVDTFAYRRDNVLYKNKPTKAAYQRALNRRLELVVLNRLEDPRFGRPIPNPDLGLAAGLQ